MQMYLLLIDYGRSYPGKTGPSGYQAVVDPEQTRRSIVSEVRDLLNSDDMSVAFVKFIDGSDCFDVTAEIVAEAQDANILQAAE